MLRLPVQPAPWAIPPRELDNQTDLINEVMYWYTIQEYNEMCNTGREGWFGPYVTIPANQADPRGC